MNGFRKFKPHNVLASRRHDSGGICKRDAVAEADRLLQENVTAIELQLDELLVQFEHWLNKPDALQADVMNLYDSASTVSALAAFSNQDLGRAAQSLCRLLGECATPSLAAVKVHVNAIVLLRKAPENGVALLDGLMRVTSQELQGSR